MIKTLANIRLWAVILLLLETVSLATLTYLYVIDFEGFQAFFSLTLLVLSIAGIMLLNIIFILTSVSRIINIRQRNDLKTAEIIGNDVQEAYQFGLIGMAVTDENHQVLWTNDLLNERLINILDTDILAWRPELEPLTKNNEIESVKIEVNSQIYEVKYLPQARLFIFKDVTQNESLYQINKNQSPVVGLLVLDNYQEASPTFDEGNEVILSIRKAINDYAAKFGILIKKFRNDAYICITNYEIFRKVYKDKFSILTEIRDMTKDQRIPITISLGVGLGFPDDILKLHDMAAKACDIAISRGGGDR